MQQQQQSSRFPRSCCPYVLHVPDYIFPPILKAMPVLSESMWLPTLLLNWRCIGCT
jgi:hypothetical protein